MYRRRFRRRSFGRFGRRRFRRLGSFRRRGTRRSRFSRRRSTHRRRRSGFTQNNATTFQTVSAQAFNLTGSPIGMSFGVNLNASYAARLVTAMQTFDYVRLKRVVMKIVPCQPGQTGYLQTAPGSSVASAQSKSLAVWTYDWDDPLTAAPTNINEILSSQKFHYWRVDRQLKLTFPFLVSNVFYPSGTNIGTFVPGNIGGVGVAKRMGWVATYNGGGMGDWYANVSCAPVKMYYPGPKTIAGVLENMPLYDIYCTVYWEGKKPVV